MDFTVPLSGERCEDSTDSYQRLIVIGTPVPAAPIDPALDVLASGTFGTKDLVLRFFPASPPDRTLGRCQGTIPYNGPGPACFLEASNGGIGPDPAACPPANQISGSYLAFSDSRITDPLAPQPLVIHLPPKDGALQYEDWRQVQPASGVDSVFDIVALGAGAP
jgi:hypothetical protein